MIGQTISHYTILEKLGEGGMGIVYKAHDTKLDRDVALKFLPPYLGSDASEKERFYHEARAASTLLHANVAVIFEVNEHEGRLFLAMECVAGQTLKKLIQTESSLSIKRVLDIAIQICEGLAAAHEKGVVHRDIKSDNIMITPKGQVKIMDFGLAKIKGASKLTKTGSTLGTAAYMSPEQAQGEEVDHRSDIFSVGVVLYELVAGRLPFRGEHQAALMYSLINEEPQPLARFNEKVGDDLQRIVSKALAKDRDERYQHTDDMLADLRRERKKLEYASAGYATSSSSARPSGSSSATDVHPVPPSEAKPAAEKRKYLLAAIAGVVLLATVAVIFILPQKDSSESANNSSSRKVVVVLPFENLGTDDQEYFADGVTDEITSKLSGLSGLAVIARTSAMHYKKTAKSLKDIGSELGVDYALQGTIRWGTTADNKSRVRVNPALIKVSDATQVWSQSYDAVLSDVFTMQSDIASQVANALGITLLQPERKAIEEKLTENSDAYDAYLRGRNYFTRSYTKQDFEISIQMFEKAVEIDPTFAAAFAKMGESHLAMYWFYYDHTNERLATAKQVIDKALTLDPELADAHQSLGYYYYWGFLDYENALRELNVAQKSKPNDSRLLLAIGSVQRRQGKFELAATTMVKGFELDPRSSEIAYNAAQTYTLLRKYEDAFRYIDRALSLAPDISQRIGYKASMHWLSDGDLKAAKVLIDQALVTADVNDKVLAQWHQAINEKFSGNYQGALGIFKAGLTRPYDDQFQFIPPSLQMAELYALMGNKDLKQKYYDSARVMLETLSREQPEEARFQTSLGIAYAGLGQKDEAIRAGKRGVELLPISKEAWRGARRLRDLAKIYVMVGNYPEAVAILRTLFAMPSEVSPTLLRIDPAWKPLHRVPDYQKLIAEFGK